MQLFRQLPLSRQRGIGNGSVRDIAIDFDTLGTNGHGRQTRLELTNDVVAEKEHIAIKSHVDTLCWMPFYGTVQLHRRLVLQRGIADIVILVERVVQIVAIGLRHRWSTTTPPCSKGELIVGC